MEINQKKNFIINFMFYGLLIGIFFVLFKYIVPILVPFIIAFGIAFVLKKPIRFVAEKLKLNRRLVGLVLLILFYLIVGSLILLMSAGVVSLLGELITRIPNIYNQVIEPLINDLYSTLKAFNNSLAPSMQSVLDGAITSLIDLLKQFFTSISSMIVVIITSIISSTPNLVISIVLMIISSFFFVLDYDKIVDFAMSHLDAKSSKLYYSVQQFIKDKLVVIVKSYIIIMSLTFVELAIGLSLLGIDKAIWIALGIAMLDILPVFGTGGVMLPWMVISFVQGNNGLAIGLLVIYLIITVIRNIIEPKIVGGELGLHPIVTLASMLVGARLFGVIGLFGIPIFISFVLYNRELQQQKAL